jgi:hypothetical protein
LGDGLRREKIEDGIQEPQGGREEWNKEMTLKQQKQDRK